MRQDFVSFHTILRLSQEFYTHFWHWQIKGISATWTLRKNIDAHTELVYTGPPLDETVVCGCLLWQESGQE
jgi:hypothetical protein